MRVSVKTDSFEISDDETEIELLKRRLLISIATLYHYQPL